jgi:LysR family transcriptional regulator, regulator of abg operon
MKLLQLVHLAAIVEHRSLRAAGRRLGVPQPALTRSIRSLEKELGIALFARETSGMVLTEAGRRFHVRASTIVHEAQRARDDIAQLSGDHTGTVHVALSIMPHVGMLPHALAPFHQRYPKVKLQITEALFPQAEGALREGVMDFYLGAAPRELPAPGLQLRHLFDNTRAVVCRMGHPLGAARSLQAISGAQWAITAVDYNAEDDLARLFAGHGLPAPEVALRARSAMSIMVAVAHSDLMAMLPAQWGSWPMTRDTLQVVPIREVLVAPPIVCIRRSDLPLTPAAEVFLDLLLRHQPSASPVLQPAA